jgi:hypothetical protein
METLRALIMGKNSTFASPTYQKLIEASEKPLIGVFPSMLQVIIGTVHLVASAFFSIAAGTIGKATCNNRLKYAAWMGTIHTFAGALAIINGLANIFSLTYFNNHADPKKFFRLF